MIRISPRSILCSLLTLAAATFAYAADDAPAKDELPPQKDLPPEVLKALFPEGAETDPAKISAEAFLRMARRAPAGESWAKMEGTATHRRSGSSAPVQGLPASTPSASAALRTPETAAGSAA